MGRSVDQLTNASEVWFMHPELENEWDWQDFKDNLGTQLAEAFPSLKDANRWDGRETHIFLDNNLVEFGLSEYCGLVSLSVRPKVSDYAGPVALAERFITLITPKVATICGHYSALEKIGTFSNGEAIYRKAI
jgi:hypothetical protein